MKNNQKQLKPRFYLEEGAENTEWKCSWLIVIFNS